ncbi:prion-inhibition and propagation-domain-containing protein [Xylariaceae sp. FL0594]|nr:prion-inhibition and propagation-domain-containing protein [Xylariaceae sp. FL0594]
MDVAGLAVGIVGLYTTCRDCYSFFTTVKTAEAEASKHLRELVIQQSILKAWGFHWQIQNDDSGGPHQPALSHSNQRQTKLHEYLSSNRFKAEGVFNTLSALADTLSNQEKLTKRYGIQLQPTGAIQDKPHRMSILNKFKWALKDRDDFNTLLSDLRSHSESLYRLCPETAFGSMNIYLTMDCLASQELAALNAEIDERSSVREGYKLLASAATLKAKVNENRGKVQADDGPLTSIAESQPEMSYLGKGLALFEGQVVHVEMRDYRGPPLGPTPEEKEKIKRQRRRARLLKSLGVDGTELRYFSQVGLSVDEMYGDSSSDEADSERIKPVRPADPNLRALIKNFFSTFQGENAMKSVSGLNIAGMIDHTDGEHKGHCSILYKLPGTIGLQSRERPAENLKLRAPVTLKSLLGHKFKQGIRSTLGARFELARNIVRAVCLLHSSGWLHKNIRAESVMFFPEHVNTLQEDRFEIKVEIDVSKPILMGYIFSRPDDIGSPLDQMYQSRVPPVTPLEVPHVPPFDPLDLDEPHIPPVKPLDREELQPHIPQVVTSRGPDDSESHSGYTWVNNTNAVETPKQIWKTSRFSSIYGRDMLNRPTVTEEAKDISIGGSTLDYYQHPAKHADTMRKYRHAYDVYSLGILLLEVGLWEQLKNYDDLSSGYNKIPDYDDEDHYERRRWVCREYLDRLRWACGDVYADVVLKCLMVDSMDDEVAQASERELCARLVADLEGCRA